MAPTLDIEEQKQKLASEVATYGSSLVAYIAK